MISWLAKDGKFRKIKVNNKPKYINKKDLDKDFAYFQGNNTNSKIDLS